MGHLYSTATSNFAWYVYGPILQNTAKATHNFSAKNIMSKRSGDGEKLYINGMLTTLLVFEK